MTMLEKIARAIGETDVGDGGTIRGVIEAIAELAGKTFDEARFRADMLVIARAAVEAMREPSEATTAAASDWIETETGQCFGRDYMVQLWQAQIDAILNEER